MDDKIKSLLQRFNEGNASSNEIQEIEALLENGIIEIEQIPGFSQFSDLLNSSFYHDVKMPDSNAFANLINQLELMSATSSNRENGERKSAHMTWQNVVRIAAIFIIGLIGGYFLNDYMDQTDQLEALKSEFSDMKLQMMVAQLNKPIAQERLNGIQLTSGLGTLDQQVSGALLRTLTNDQNVNVRLAALDVLADYLDLPFVREGLVQTIPIQDAPLVQLRVAEMMGAIQQKNALEPLYNWLSIHGMEEPYNSDFMEYLEPLNFEL
jgi:hypothetical protein